MKDISKFVRALTDSSKIKTLFNFKCNTMNNLRMFP